ncbi:hypothetical protein [Candidatus Igneacidithiobacillus taiwanensis]|uniref:hypothetical protein n=1 Tax=Candidatus Igneacidithiobacillus taiwanensis TaxID=1945924 RepID=UPI00289C5252|nr:hypothetical protein [Candidatus Igneacidithiobacillus taiwanensis]
MAKFDPLVFDNKVAFMQQIMTFVRLGFTNYITGEIIPEKADGLVKKFARYYDINQDRHQRLRAKKRGEGCAVLVLYQSKKEPLSPILWALLVTNGEHVAHKAEPLKDALNPKTALNITGYELVKITKKDIAKPVWSWRMSKQTYESWQLRIIEAVRSKNNARIKIEVDSLHKSPGFAAIRQQIRKLNKLLKGEWKRAGHEKGFPPGLPQRLYYVKRLPNTGKQLSVIVKRAKTAITTQEVEQIAA